MKIKIFHGSRDCFDNILLYKCCDIGFHCGTLEQAIHRIIDGGTCYVKTFFNSYIYEFDIDINEKEMITLPDCISWADLSIVKEKLSNEYPSMIIDNINSLESLREYLANKGIKYIRYKNEIEGKGYSYILLDENINFTRYTVRDIINKISEQYGKS